MTDTLIRAMTRDGFVKITAVSTTGITRRAREIHHTTAVATAALGRVLAAASMIGNMQKSEDGSITLIIKGGGPLGTLLATADPEGNPRGYVENPQIQLIDRTFDFNDVFFAHLIASLLLCRISLPGVTGTPVLTAICLAISF